MKKVLVMLSGGPDSIYEAARRLKETDEEIHLHHISIMNGEGGEERMMTEQAVVMSAYAGLFQIRPCSFSRSLINHQEHSRIPYDMALVCFEAGVCANAHIDTAGKTPFTHWTIGTCQEEGHWQERFDELEKITKAVCWKNQAPIFELGTKLLNKKDELDYLTALGLEWTSCRTPKNGEPCGKCFKCRYQFKIYEHKS